ncbi:tRNA-splicing endonuclease, subunit Sen54 [Artemisia annua]|uniref:tRNA-splicing endonuclease, subunit Sen54 n=1 Tax=Artemisia annua TaxID=35608 RepID=A0A2U1NIZ0_ARTAN|nr:tRNA-splicing endonuclease, subunit Sen54 [Artemisia annua]
MKPGSLKMSGVMDKAKVQAKAPVVKKSVKVVEKVFVLWNTPILGLFCVAMCRFLEEIGALHLFDDENRCIPLKDIYKKVAGGVGGSSWESFEVLLKKVEENSKPKAESKPI